MTNGISPSTALWINVVFLVLTGIAAGSVTLAGVPDDAVAMIKAWSANAAWFISVLNIVFHLFSSTDAGPGVANK
jgi:hypothetical protein